VRVPAWCASVSLAVDGAALDAPVTDGYLVVRRVWTTSTVVASFVMPARFVEPHPRIDALRGCVAVLRGPVVYALEQADLPAELMVEDVRILEALSVDLSTSPPAVVCSVAAVRSATDDLYPEECELTIGAPFDISIGPYFQWASRTPGAMRVWIPIAKPALHKGKQEEGSESAAAASVVPERK